MHIAVLRYETKHGTDHILFRTDATVLTQLPTIDNVLLLSAGVTEPDIETEAASWEAIYNVKYLPHVAVGAYYTQGNEVYQEIPGGEPKFICKCDDEEIAAHIIHVLN